MEESSKPLALAIDGGGTRCRFALEQSDGRLVTEAGPANVSTDFDKAVECLQGGLQTLAELAGTTLDALRDLPAFVGLAGVMDGAITSRLSEALPLRNAQYDDDRLAALRGALGRHDGVIAHCGTGSFFGAQLGKDTRFAGGWGATLGDEASALWIGRRALRQLLRCVDELDTLSPLSRELLSHFGDVQGVLEFASDARPTDFGTIAPRVTAQAKAGDAVAASILQAAADHIATDLRLIGWKPGLRICLTGGIGPQYAPYLPEDMKSDLAEPLAEPLDGAIALALERETQHGHR